MRPATVLRGLGIAAAAAIPVVSSVALRRATDRLLEAPRHAPGEDALRPAVDALGGEVVRFRSRDGVALAGRWLRATVRDGQPERADRVGASAGEDHLRAADAEPGWTRDPHEAVLLLHGYSGSIAPDLVEYAPFLLRTASVLGVDFRGHGDSADGPTTFGLLEVEDIAGALAWLGERGVSRVALFGTSLGGISAIAAAAVLGDGRVAVDTDPDAPRLTAQAPRPRLVAIVADSVPAEVATPVGNRLPGPFGPMVADRLFALAARRLGGDPRATEPGRSIVLLEGVPLMLIHGTADRTVPIGEGQRLAALAPPGTRHMVITGADHSAGHATDPLRYESGVTAFLRDSIGRARETAGSLPILPDDAPPGTDAGEGADERA